MLKNWELRDVVIGIHCHPTQTNEQAFALANMIKRFTGFPPYILSSGEGIQCDGFEVLNIAGDYSEGESPKVSYVKLLELGRVLGKKWGLMMDSEFPLNEVEGLVEFIQEKIEKPDPSKMLYIRQTPDHSRIDTQVIFGTGYVLKMLSPLIGFGAGLGEQMQSKIQEYEMQSICDELEYKKGETEGKEGGE